MSAVALGALLIGVLLLLLAALVWQEARSRREEEGAVYVMEDAVRYVLDRLSEDEVRRLRQAGVQRILEWEIFYLQGLAQEKRWNPVETVAGGHEPAVAYIVEQITAKHGVSYSLADVRRVLELEAGYLVEIGAVGGVVNDDTDDEDTQGEDHR